MRLIPLLLALACLSCITASARADNGDPEPEQAENYQLLEPSGLSLGVAVVSSTGVRLGEDQRTLVVPVLGYEGERMFLRGISGGVHVFKRNGVELDLLVAARLDSWDARDLDAVQLAARGIDRSLLVDRDRGIEAGLGLVWKGSAGRLGLELRTDVSNASSGYEAKLGYSFAVPAGKGLLAPGVGVSYWSSKLSEYYYGTLPEEEAAGVPAYRPGDALVPNVSLGYLRALPGRWRLFGIVEYQWLPGGIVHSPLAEGDRGVPSLFVGVSRSFGATD